MTSYFPDVNVWLALHAERHEHHTAAVGWFDSLDEQQLLVFCRQTQLGFFRLLTTPAVMGNEILTQRQCWSIYEQWLAGGRAAIQSEPETIEPVFRAGTSVDEPATKTWTDGYLAAFAEAAVLRLVTFDKALAGKAKGSVLLS
jgi:toxin-antitoxin system PIN domain toxin